MVNHNINTQRLAIYIAAMLRSDLNYFFKCSDNVINTKIPYSNYSTPWVHYQCNIFSQSTNWGINNYLDWVWLNSPHNCWQIAVNWCIPDWTNLVKVSLNDICVARQFTPRSNQMPERGICKVLHILDQLHNILIHAEYIFLKNIFQKKSNCIATLETIFNNLGRNTWQRCNLMWEKYLTQV